MLALALAFSLSGCGQEETGPGTVPTADAAAPTAAPTPAPAPQPTTPPEPAAVSEPTLPAAAESEPPAADFPDALLGNSGGEATLVQLVDPLDEPEFYCVDVPGFGAGLNLAAAMTAHTCKPGADDELFRTGAPLPGNLLMPAYQLCLEAAAAEPAAALFLKDCSDSPLQRFSLGAGGSLQLAGTAYCLTIAPGVGEPTGGPSHLRRELTLEDCGAVPAELRSWQLPGPSPA